MADYPVEIPDAARQVKANYAERPSDELVREIKQFITATGTPHLWHGHTHTKPPRGGMIDYRGKFDLPKSHSGPLNRARWAPCPCCHPDSAWYYKDGYIVWFPQEQVIRNIGGDCFKEYYGEIHDEAMRQFRREEAARRNREYLLANLGMVPEVVRVIERALLVAGDVDKARFILANRLTRQIDFDLWNHVRPEGVLMIQGEERTEYQVRADGTEESRKVHDLERYGVIAGFAMLDPTAKPIAPKLERELEKLRSIDFGDNFRARVENMNDEERRKAANNLAKPLNAAKEQFAEIEDCRRFLSAVTVATLNGWGRHDKSPARVYFEIVPQGLLIGSTSDDAQTMRLGDSFHNVLGQLPSIGSIREV